ncbi:MAG: hypothetical protein ACK5ZR_05900 [Gemmatimonadaceae bacterium]|jgi:hypothetical protein
MNRSLASWDLARRRLVEAFFVAPAPFWLGFVGGVAFAVAVCSEENLPWAMEERVRLASGLLQLAGTGVLFVGIASRIAAVDGQSVSLRIGDWFSRVLGIWVAPRSIVAHLSSALGLSVSGRATGTLSSSGPPDRLKILEEKVAQLEAQLAAYHDAMHKQHERLEAEVRTLRQRVTDEVREIRSVHRETSVGGIRLEITAALWIVVGQAVATWPRLFTI